EKHKTGSHDVRRRFEPVRYHGGGVSGHSGDDFDRGQRARDQHSRDGDPLPGLHCIEFRLGWQAEAPAPPYARAASIFSVFTPSSAKAATAFWASNLPSRARRESAAAAMDSALISKWRRRYSRLSLRPKPSVPSVS